jgi:tryptophanyl-tRNA synthetase
VLPPNLGAELYPALMAADLLGLRPTIVTQLTPSFERLDYSCRIAEEINDRLGKDFFPVPRLVGDFPQPPATPPDPQDLFVGPWVFGEASEFRVWLSALNRYGDTHQLRPEIASWLDCIASRLIGADLLKELRDAAGPTILSVPSVRDRLADLITEQLRPSREAFREMRSKGTTVEEVMGAGAVRVRSELKETVESLRDIVGLGRLHRSSR